MKPGSQVVDAKPCHIRSIARRMREADRAEVFAASGKTSGQALAFSLRKSTIAKTWLIDGRPEAMFGVGDINILAGVGAPWLLGTDVIEAHQIEFLRQSRVWRGQLLRRYSTLRNLVDVRNAASIRWLRWLGFTLSDPMDWRGHSFRLFELGSADVRFNDGANDRLHGHGCSRADTAGTGDSEGEPL